MNVWAAGGEDLVVGTWGARKEVKELFTRARSSSLGDRRAQEGCRCLGV